MKDFEEDPTVGTSIPADLLETIKKTITGENGQLFKHFLDIFCH
jgi:hypothetical protein